MIIEIIRVGALEVNCYVLAVKDGAQAIIIDPGDDENKIRKALDRHKLQAGMIINTHGHYDHIGCDDKFNVEICAHRDELALLKDPALNFSQFLSGSPFSLKNKLRALADKEIISFAGIELEVIHTPGHSPGGIALLLKKPKEKILFSGDSLFCGAVGRTDFLGGNHEQLIKGIKERLLILPEDTIVYPGHGPSSTIGEEKRNNPFLISA